MLPEERAEEAFRLAGDGRAEEARAAWREARDMAVLGKDFAGAVEIGLRWAEAEARWGDPGLAEEVARQQLKFARAKGLRGRPLVRAELLLGRVARSRPGLERAVAHLMLALEEHEARGGAEAGELLDLALGLASLGFLAAAEEAYAEAARCAAGREKAKAWMGLAEVWYRLGRVEDALGPARRALREARRAGEDDLVPELLGNLMIYLAGLGRVGRARRLWAILERCPRPKGWERRFGAEVANVLWESGERAEAVRWAGRALEAGAAEYQAVLAHHVLWREARAAGDEERAYAELETILREASKLLNAPPERAYEALRLLRDLWVVVRGEPGC